jgi:hypothetical protein
VTNEIDRQEAMVQVRRANFNAVCENERALKLARRNATMQELPAFIVILLSAHNQLVILHHHVQLLALEPSYR